MPSTVSDRFRERESNPEGKERRRHKASRAKRKKEEIRDGSPVSERKSFRAASTSKRKASMPIPKLGRRPNSASPNGSRISLPYPSFSKEHSREAVGSKESIDTPPRKDIFTPDPTDLQDKMSPAKNGNANRDSMYSQAVNVNGPPSPPLTATESSAATIEEKRGKLEKQGEDMRARLGGRKESRAVSGTQMPSRASPLSSVKRSEGPHGGHRSNSGTPTRSRPRPASGEDSSSSLSNRSNTQSYSSGSTPASKIDTSSAVNSDSTSITPTRQKLQTPFAPDADDESSPTTESDSSLKTPTPRGTPFPAGGKQTPGYMVPLSTMLNGNGDSPMPPPPPPPPAPLQPPRVDYLVQNGGLPYNIPKSFISAAEPDRSAPFVVGSLPNPSAMASHVQRLFAPFSKVLEDYEKVMAKNGSVAVATGYKSIARRLLDRLENVFARDISSEVCACMMCDTPDNMTLDDERGINWGEILEYVSGRKELPAWPPFVLDHEPVGLGICGEELRTPMQELDMDVPEQYREHYIRQSKKTKESVDRWLAGQNADTDAPEDADDDTLTFAILTHLEPERRPIFSHLLGVASSRPASVKPDARAQTPLNAPKSELIVSMSLALQRLYRLINPPRAPECAIYLLNNQHLHNVLATIAAISDGEWDILISGRFDGFLRSGAEEISLPPVSQPPSRTASRPGGSRLLSRGPTPLSVPTPAPGAPVAMDEETEIAVLAEVEREIHMGMEALEDAFESLHVSAEGVRRALRERGAGLSMASQARRGAAAGVVEARLGTPASARGWDSEDGGTDDGMDDGMSEIAPDDSASNFSRSRVRRPKRRVERRTPAPVEEEEKDEGAEGKSEVREREREKAPSRTALWSRNSMRKR
ncbi:MAG: hypothetical protein LQ340_005776 [Diploschistes diacapsis]|nr:MAG: hypothetical protein LQ340_005776 [Diploschistes diacapsis]